MDYEEVLMVKIAWYYYIENITQQKISEMLGISRMRVIKLLEKAQQSGIIQFKIREDSANHIQIEKQIMEKYKLKDVFVVPTNPNESDVNETIAKAATMYISDRLTDNPLINIGYGDTLGRVLNYLSVQSDKSISYVSLTGGVNYYLNNSNKNGLNAKLYLIPAPILASTKEMVAAMKQENSVKEISKLVRMSSMTLVGIGGMADNSTILQAGVLTKNDLLYLSMKGAVGDILSHFIDKDGKLVQSEIEDRLISTPLDTLKELNNVIAVAAGESKVDAIKATLNGEYIDILITDENTASKLI